MSENILEDQLFEIIRNKEMPTNIKFHKIDMLVKLGVNVNAMYGAKSALKLAMEEQNSKITNFLREQGASEIFDNEKANELGVKLCEICGRKYADTNISEIKELIDMGADVNAKSGNGQVTALIKASVNGYKEIVEVLIQNGADVNAKDIDNRTALMRASYNNYNEIVELLLQNGADVNVKDIDSRTTALMEASLRGNKEVMEVLIQNGADVNAKCSNDWTALMFASYNGYEECAELLIQNEADVNAKTNNGGTALMLALIKCRKNVVQLLISKGADVNMKDNKGHNTIEYANPEMKKIIIEAVKKRNDKAGENVVIHGVERE